MCARLDLTDPAEPMLNARQQQMFDYLKSEIGRTGVSPTVRQIADANGYRGKSFPHHTLGVLEDLGFIRRLRNRHQAIEIIERPEDRRAQFHVVDTTPVEVAIFDRVAVFRFNPIKKRLEPYR